MLQQTQVDRVIPKFHEFLGKNILRLQDLAVKLNLRKFRKTWYPLGYNIRPYRLHGIACDAMERYGGSIPSKEEELLSMKGIGRYTAGAIQSFAFQKDAAILDTNVMRVLHQNIYWIRVILKKQKRKIVDAFRKTDSQGERL